MSRTATEDKQPLYDKPPRLRDTRDERDLGYGRVLDHKGRKRVEIMWDVNPSMTARGLCILKVGHEEVVVNAEQLMKFLRWV